MKSKFHATFAVAAITILIFISITIDKEQALLYSSSPVSVKLKKLKCGLLLPKSNTNSKLSSETISESGRSNVEEVSDGLVEYGDEDEDEDNNSTSNDNAGEAIDNGINSIIANNENETTTIGNSNSSTNGENSSSEKSLIPISEASDVYIFPDRTRMNEIESYDELTNQTSLHNDLLTPRDLHILFMGDSVTRYQYIDLVYFLKYGSWMDPDDEEPSFVMYKEHESWNAYYNFTNERLKPYEQCDCYHQGIKVGRYEQANYVENRYFLDTERNNSVTYLQKFGDDFLKSSWDVFDIHNPHDDGGLFTEIEDFKPVQWMKSWVEAIEEFVCKMEPKPSVFIFNAGLWKNNDLKGRKGVTVQGEIVEALKKCDILSMYKTTNHLKRHRGYRSMADYEEQACNQTDYCLDLTWTGLVPKRLYADDVHFRPPVYSYINLQLLSLLSSVS